MKPNSARTAPQGVQLVTSDVSADLVGDGAMRTAVNDAAAAREMRALHMFQQRSKEMSAASLRMTDAVVELRDARAAVQTQK